MRLDPPCLRPKFKHMNRDNTVAVVLNADFHEEARVGHLRNLSGLYPCRSRSDVKRIENELQLLTFRQREVQKRIQSVRHAMSALIEVFGPGILDGNNEPFRMMRNRPSHLDIIGLCSTVLGDTSQWLTLQQITALIQSRCPRSIAGFQKPSVSISNALRTLRRRGRVECVYPKSSETRWRWCHSSSRTANRDPEPTAQSVHGLGESGRLRGESRKSSRL